LLISSSTFEHISPDFGLALKHLSQFLTPDGVTIFDVIDWGDPNYSSCSGCESGVYVRIYSLSEIEAITINAGFKILSISSVGYEKSRFAT
jgi:hypothetical protein